MSSSLSSIVVQLIIIVFCNSCGSTAQANDQYHHNSNLTCRLLCLPWQSIDEVSCTCKCRENHNIDEIKCLSDEEPVAVLEFGYCLTSSADDVKMQFQLGICSYFVPQMPGHNITREGYVKLPSNMSEINDYLCGLMNRQGPQCGECIEDFGPALTSIGYTCSNCSDVWYGVPFYLLVVFVPITVLYFVVLIFQINVTSAPVACFIMYSQLILFDIRYERRPPMGRLIYQVHGPMLSILNIVYGVVNLELIQPIIPPFCVSSRLQFIHISVIEYLPALYPLILIVLTWICIELHGRNFRVLVLAWKPLHKCFFYLRKGWSTKSDLVGVFATFFLLSYSKILFQSFLLIRCETSIMFDKENFLSVSTTRYDPSKSCRSGSHIAIATFAIVVLCVFNIMPTLVLVLYPVKAFRACRSKCKINGIVITTFVEKYHSCYKEGLDGGRDR